MKTYIDLKSALCGLAIGVLAMLAMGATNASQPIGRYQVAGGAGFFMILDSSSGRGWYVNLAGQNMTGTTPGFWEPKVDR